MPLKIQNKFENEQIVYLYSDGDQSQCFITGILILHGNALMYRVSGADGEDYYYDFEISPTKVII